MTDEIKEILKGATVQGKFLMYKERPLVREGNTILYGNMDDEYILQLIIMNEKETDGKTVPSLSDGDRIVKQELRSGLYEAFELGTIWLERLIGE